MGQIADVIKYEGTNSYFVYKHPTEDFNSLTQLIVHESQEALFMMNGQALDLFGPGRHTLETQNIPKIGKAFNRMVGDQTPFHCEVYFVNKTEQMAIKWGTDSRVQYMDPTYGFPVAIGASGEMTLRAEDARKLLVKLVGTERDLSQQRLVQYFRAFLMTRVKSYMAQTIKAQKINVFEIDAQLQSLSDNLCELLRPDFADYGMALERFFVTTIVLPEEDPQFKKFRDLHYRKYSEVEEAKLQQQLGVIQAQTAAQQTVIESQALAQKRAQEGYTYQQERGFDVAQTAAGNEGVGQYSNLGIGLGMMAGVGGAVSGVVGNSINGAVGNPAAVEAKCAKCGAALPTNAKFCLECGEKVIVASADTVVCPECGQTVAKGKFCPECGHKFVTACPKCGASVAGGKFCPECGEKL